MDEPKVPVDNTAGLLGILGKVKDGLKSRKDLVALGIRKDLHPIPHPNGKQYLPRLATI